MADKYSEYFDIDEDYFPIINDSTIHTHEATDPDFWMRTYPHESFIKMLRELEKILARLNKKSLWIEGVYGSGKSQCAYALSHILADSPEKVTQYWSRYEALTQEKSLLLKLLGHKQNKPIVVARRYSSSEIHNDRNLYSAIQESVSQALKEAGVEYTGQRTLCESMIEWFSDEVRQKMFDTLLKEKYSSVFGASVDAKELLNILQKSKDDEEKLNPTMNNIFRIAEENGIVALTLTVDNLCDWIRDVVETNKIQFVLIWDEFTEFFDNNKNLTAFQKIVELCSEIPFYFIIVTHYKPEESGKTPSSSSKKLRDRFVSCPIELPESVAFELVAAALKVKSDPKVQKSWDSVAEDLNARLSYSRNAIMKGANIKSEKVLKGILPLHPTAAFVLKHIAAAYQSNQRSMFDFIKTPYKEEPDLHAFRWYAKNYAPGSDFPFLTIDLLWDFFYDHGAQYLTPGVKRVLDAYGIRKGKLNSDERAILKTVLILQALSVETKGMIELLLPTEENLRLAFEGTNNLDGNSSVSCANVMVNKGVFLKRPLDKNRFIYAVEDAGEEIPDLSREAMKTRALACADENKSFEGLLNLSAALKLRFEAHALGAAAGKTVLLTKDDFSTTLAKYRDSEPDWKFQTFVAIAQNADEAEWLRERLQAEANKDENRAIVFIDATSENLAEEQLRSYAQYGGHALYYQGKDKEASQKYADMCKKILADWREAIQNGPFTVYYAGKKQQTSGLQGIALTLQEIVRGKYPRAFEFTQGLSENTLRLTQAIASAKCGMIQKTSNTVGGIEKKLFPAEGIWQTNSYWTSAPNENVSVVKIALEKFIQDAFKQDGRVSVQNIWTFLEETFGFARCNLYAFLAGFLLKEYAVDQTLRYADVNGAQEEMKPESLAEALGNIVSEKTQKDAFIVSQTKEERKLYEVAKEAWDARKPSSPAAVGDAVIRFVRKRGFPIDALKFVADPETYGYAFGFVELARASGSDQQDKALELGAKALKKPALVDSLKAALSEDSFLEGAMKWLADFDDGKLQALADRIGAALLHDVKSLFDVKYQSLWSRETQEAELQKLETEYRFVELTNKILNVYAPSRAVAFEEWRKQLDFCRVSHEAFAEIASELAGVLRAVYAGGEVLHDRLQVATSQFEEKFDAFAGALNAQDALFRKEYAPWLDGLSEEEIDQCVANLPSGMFPQSRSQCNALVKKTVANVKRSGMRGKLLELWKAKTGAKNAREWSQIHQVPIQCLVEPNEFLEAKKTFETLSTPSASDHDVELALEFCEKSTLFAKLDDDDAIRAAFASKFLANRIVNRLVGYEQAVDALKKLPCDVYDWFDYPGVDATLEKLAETEYDAGGEAKVLERIDTMDDASLKRYLKTLVKGNKRIGMEILLDSDG